MEASLVVGLVGALVVALLARARATLEEQPVPVPVRVDDEQPPRSR
jgi:hypothetical protein